MRSGGAVVVAAVAVGGVLAWSEFVHERSSRRGVARVDATGRREAVVVLGYADRGPRANAVNRYRVRAALRTRSADAAESVLVLCGGAVAAEIPEADLMADYARGVGYTGPLRLERTSRTTWENVQNAIPLIEHADVIKIVSNSLHAEKARGYLAALRPDLAERLARAEEQRIGEVAWMKPAAAVRGLWDRRSRV